jgi:hypothetical protein
VLVFKKVVGEFFSALVSVLFLHQRSHEGMIVVTPQNFTQSGTKFAEAAAQWLKGSKTFKSSDLSFRDRTCY